MVGIASDQRQIGPRGLVWFCAALLPIPQRAERDVITGGKFLLGQLQGTADDFRLWRPLHPLKVGFGQWLRVAIGAGRLLDGFRSHRPRRFAGNSRRAHVGSPCGLK